MKGSKVFTPFGEEIILDDIGQENLFENEQVRVWSVSLEPGGTQYWHLHHNPYLVLCIDESEGRMDWLDNSEPRFPYEYAGGAVLRPTSPVHRLTNIGETRYTNRLIEFKALGESRPQGVAPDDLDGGARARPENEVLLADDLVQVMDSPYVGVWRTESNVGAQKLPDFGVPRIRVAVNGAMGSDGVSADAPSAFPSWLVDLRYLAPDFQQKKDERT